MGFSYNLLLILKNNMWFNVQNCLIKTVILQYISTMIFGIFILFYFEIS